MKKKQNSLEISSPNCTYFFQTKTTKMRLSTNVLALYLPGEPYNSMTAFGSLVPFGGPRPLASAAVHLPGSGSACGRWWNSPGGLQNEANNGGRWLLPQRSRYLVICRNLKKNKNINWKFRVNLAMLCCCLVALLFFCRVNLSTS